MFFPGADFGEGDPLNGVHVYPQIKGPWALDPWALYLGVNMGSVQWVALTKIGTQKKHGLRSVGRPHQNRLLEKHGLRSVGRLGARAWGMPRHSIRVPKSGFQKGRA